MTHAVRIFFLTALFSLSVALAQPLTALAPEGALLTLGWNGDAPKGARTLQRDLAALDWARAGRTLEALFALSGDETFRGLTRGYGNMLQGGETFLADCPEFERLEKEFRPPDMAAEAPREALLTVSISAYNPLPAGTAMLRVGKAEVPALVRFQRALIACLEREGQEVARLREGNVPLFVLGNGGDFPVVISRVGRLFLAGTNPEVLRGIIRRARGSDEPSFADSTLYARTTELLNSDGATLSFDAAALGEVVQTFGDTLASDPQAKPLLRRAVAILRTLGGYVGAIRTTSEGVLFESRLAVNPQGGDPALARLLLCDTCTLTGPTLAPEGSVAVYTQALPLRNLINYAQGLLDEAAPVTGEPVKLRALLKQELDFDLDVGLLNWFGNEITSVTLEPVSTDLRTLLGGRAQALILSVRGREAAEAGRKELVRALRSLPDKIASDGETDFSPESLSQASTTRSTYRSVPVTRYRFGPNGDLGVAYLGDNLVLGSPAASVKTIIDTSLGRTPSLLASAAYRTAQTGVPEQVTQLGFSNLRAQVAGVGNLLKLLSQPLAFTAAAGLSSADEAAAPSYADLLHLTDILPNALSVIASHLSTSSSYTQVRENTRVQHLLIRVAW